MTTTFYNIAISIEAETETEAYAYLCNILNKGCQDERLEYITDDFNSSANVDLRDTSELWSYQPEKGA